MVCFGTLSPYPGSPDQPRGAGPHNFGSYPRYREDSTRGKGPYLPTPMLGPTARSRGVKGDRGGGVGGRRGGPHSVKSQRAVLTDSVEVMAWHLLDASAYGARRGRPQRARAASSICITMLSWHSLGFLPLFSCSPNFFLLLFFSAPPLRHISPWGVCIRQYRLRVGNQKEKRSIGIRLRTPGPSTARETKSKRIAASPTKCRCSCTGTHCRPCRT